MSSRSPLAALALTLTLATVALAEDEPIARLGDARLRQEQFVDTLAFSPSGELLITTTDGSLSAYTMPKAELRTRVDMGERAWVIRFAPDGSLLTSSKGGIRARDPKTLEVKRSIEHGTPSYWANSVVFTPAGDRMLLATHQAAYVYSWPEGKRLRALHEMDKKRPNQLWHADLLADGETAVLVTYDQGALLYSLDGGKPKKTLSLPEVSYCLARTPAGGFAIGRILHDSKGVRVGELELSKRVGGFSKSQAKLVDVLPLPNGDFLTVWTNGSVGRHGRRGQLLSERALTFGSSFSSATNTALSPDGATWAVEVGSGVALLSAKTLEQIGGTGSQTVGDGGHLGRATAAVFAGDDQVVSAGVDGTLRRWEAKTGKELAIVSLGEGPRALDVSPDGKLLAVGAGEQTQLRRLPSLEFLRACDEATLFSHQLAFSPDSARLFASGELFNTETGVEEKVRGYLSDGPAAWAPGGILVAGKRCVQLGSGGQAIELPFLNDGQKIAAVDPSGRLIVVGEGSVSARVGGGTAACRVVFIGNGEALAPIVLRYAKWHSDLSGNTRFSPNGRCLAQVDNAGLRFFATATGKELALIPLEGGAAQSLAFSPSGERVVTAHVDGRARIWTVPAVVKAAPNPFAGAPVTPRLPAKLKALRGKASIKWPGEGFVTRYAFENAGELKDFKAKGVKVRHTKKGVELSAGDRSAGSWLHSVSFSGDLLIKVSYELATPKDYSLPPLAALCVVLGKDVGIEWAGSKLVDPRRIGAAPPPEDAFYDATAGVDMTIRVVDGKLTVDDGLDKTLTRPLSAKQVKSLRFGFLLRGATVTIKSLSIEAKALGK